MEDGIANSIGQQNWMEVANWVIREPMQPAEPQSTLSSQLLSCWKETSGPTRVTRGTAVVLRGSLGCRACFHISGVILSMSSRFDGGDFLIILQLILHLGGITDSAVSLCTCDRGGIGPNQKGMDILNVDRHYPFTV